MMKKTRRILLTLLLTITLAACGTQSAAVTLAETSSAASSPTPAPDVVKFADPVLEAMVRGAMGKPEGDISVAEAQAVTRMDMNDTLQGYLSELTPIQSLSGLEAFTNLESLNLSSHAVSDISPLQGLTKLTSLSLAGNPVADISPLAGLTELKLLILSGSQAQDYSTLSNLVNLQVLLLDNSTISDLTPIAALTNLQQLSLANTPTEDFSPLETIYPNLQQKDFIIPSTLVDLGFSLDGASRLANYDSEGVSFTINHTKWGAPPEERDENVLRMSMFLESEYKISVGLDGDLNVYIFNVDKDGQLPIKYSYETASGIFTFGTGDQTIAEQAVRAAMDVVEGEEVLLAPVRLFDTAIKNTFHMTPAKLYALPNEPPTLKNFGFFLNETNGNLVYEQHEGIYTSIQINLAEGNEKEFDVEFFQPISDEYRVVVTYFVDNKKIYVNSDDNDLGGARYEYFIDTGEHIDEWCSDPDKTVEEYFINAYNDPSIEDIYLHSVELMWIYIRDTFGMTPEQLYSLPTGE